MLSHQSNAVDGWTRRPLTGILSCSVGPWGERQRLFQKRASGPFYCSVYLADGRRHVRSLATKDRTEALRMVMGQMSTANGVAGFNDHECRVPLGRLWERYRRECETFRDTDQTHQSDTATRAAITTSSG